LKRTFTVQPENLYKRLDKFLRKQLDAIQLSSIFALLRKGNVRVNGQRQRKPSFGLQTGDVVEVTLPEKSEHRQAMQRDFSGKRKLIPTKMEISLLFENDQLLVVEKPAGISVHPGAGEGHRATLIEGLMHLGKKKGFQPYLVHRLDRNTSGILVVAKNLSASRELSALLSSREVQKTYTTLVAGEVSPQSITLPLDGKEAHTQIVSSRRIHTSQGVVCLCQVDISTGRKHQIRKHLSQIGHPVLGDRTYGNPEWNSHAKKWGVSRTFLHCSELLLPYRSGKETQRLLFRSPLPPELQQVLETLEGR